MSAPVTTSLPAAAEEPALDPVTVQEASEAGARLIWRAGAGFVISDASQASAA